MTRYPLDFVVKGSGFTINERSGETLGDRKLVYRGADTFWYLADSDAAATMPVLGITMGAIPSGNKGEILRLGYLGLATWTWTIGGEIYASPTPGELTQAIPPGVVQIIGMATDTDMLYFNSDLGSGGGGVANVVTVRRNSGANIGTRQRLNFIEGTSIAMTIADDGVGNEIDITINNANHAARHEPAGADEVNDIDISNTGTLLSAHAARHEPAGADEVNDIDIGNTGTLLSAHKSRHVVAGADTFVGGDLLDATARINVNKNNGAVVGTRREISFIEGANITLTVVDDAVNEEVEVTIAAAGAAATAWVDAFFPAPDPDTNYGTYAAVLMANGVDQPVRQTFMVPDDIVTITRAVVIIISPASGNIRRGVSTNFAAVCANEDYQTNTDSIAAGQVAVDVDEVECLDITDALTGATGSDLVGVEFTRFGSSGSDTINDVVYYIGILIQGSP